MLFQFQELFGMIMAISLTLETNIFSLKRFWSLNVREYEKF